MKKLVTVITLIFFVLSLSPVQSEREPWNCPNCGKTGNTRNYCGKCGHAAPDLITATPTPSAGQSTQTTAAPGQNRVFEFRDVTSNQQNVTLKWTDSESNMPYTVIYQSLNSGTSDPTHIAGSHILRKSFTIRGLTPGETYLIRILDKDNQEITSTYTLPGSDDYVDKSITVWVSGSVVEFTKQQIKVFKAAHPEYANYAFTVAAVGEDIAAENIIRGMDGGADVFGFAQDQLSQLVSAGFLEPVTEGSVAAVVEAEHDAGAVAAAKLGNTLYAYPMTSDNGFFLYYDQRIITDPGNLDAILAACKKAGRYFYMDITSGWYQTAFFFGAGCTLSYECDDQGNFVSINCDYASENGVKALKNLIRLAQSPIFKNGSDGVYATSIGAIVDGVWDAGVLKEKLGNGYAASKLPSVDGFQMTSFGGYKLLGVKPQSNAAKREVCSSLAAFLTSDEVQLARYHAVEWFPTSIKARHDQSFKPSEAVAAFQAQLPFTTPQGLYPVQYWELATALGNDILSGALDHATDAELLEVLKQFQDTAASYAQ